MTQPNPAAAAAKPKREPNYHDLFFHAVFQIREVALAFVKGFLPPDFVQHLDLTYFELDTTTYLEDDLKPYYSDLVYVTRLLSGAELRISILFEHKSHLPPPEFPEHVQVMNYKGGIWRLDTKQVRKPTFVLPVILYHGKRGWQVRSFWETFDNLPESWRQWVDDIKFLVVDLNKHSDEKLVELSGGTMLQGVLLAMKHTYEPSFFKRNLPKVVSFEWSKYSQALMHRFAKDLLFYLEKITGMNSKALTSQPGHYPPEWQQTVSLTIPSVFKEGMEKGREEGIEKGIEKGRELKSREFVTSLLQNCPDFSEEKIARLASVPLDFVKKMKEELLPAPGVKNGKHTPPTSRNGSRRHKKD